MIVGHPLERIINGPAHHTLHHMYFVYNYGQYFTWADRVGGSYRHPKTEDDPLNTILEQEEAKKKYAKEKEEMRLLDLELSSSKNKKAVSSSTATPTTTMDNIVLPMRLNLERRGSEFDDSMTESSISSGRTSPSYSRSDSGFEDTNSDKENKEKSIRRRK